MAPGLRERKKLDTRRALSDAALSLVFERGLDGVTREDIANRAGVSLRTFTNYFTGKYDALAYRQVERLQQSIDILRSRPPGEPLWSAITESVLAPLAADFDDEYGDENSLPTRAQLIEARKLLMIPEIRDASFRRLRDEWVATIAERTGTDAAHDTYPQLVAAVIGAVGDVAMDAYAAADPPVSIIALIRDGFAAVAAGLPPPAATGRQS